MKSKFRKILLMSSFFVATCFLGIAYALVTENATVNGIAEIENKEGITITDVALASGSGGSVTTSLINGSFASISVTLEQSASATTTVNFTVKNNTGKTQYFHDINYLTQADIEALGISDLALYDNANIVIDSSSYSGLINTALAPQGTMTIPVTFKYAGTDTSNNTLNVSINVNFIDYQECTITYERNITLDSGETVTSFPENVTTKVGQAYTPLPSAEASNHVFLGWSENAGATTADYAASSSITPSGNTTLYAVWAQYKIVYQAGNYGTFSESATSNTVNYGKNATVTLNAGTNYAEPTLSSTTHSFDGWALTSGGDYSYTGSSSVTITSLSTYNSSTYTATLYADYSNGLCVLPGTLITLGDGSKVNVENLTVEDEVLVWDFDTNNYTSIPLAFIHFGAQNKYKIISLAFDNGTNLDIAMEHGLFDLESAKYVYITAENVNEYVGHSFMYQDSDSTWNSTKLVSYNIDNQETTVYGPVSYSHLAFFANDVLTMPGDIYGLFNYFDVDVDYDNQILAYNQEKKQADIARYGLFTIDDLGDLITPFMFDAFNGQYLNVSIQKGLLNWEEIQRMAHTYGPIIASQRP